MKKLIFAMAIVASCAASASDIVVSWKSPSGATYIYHLDSESAKKIETSDGPIWAAAIAVEDSKGKIIGNANVVVDGCDLAAPAGTAGLFDDNGKLIAGTAPADWTLADFAAKKGGLVDAIASYTCIAAMANELAASRKKPAVHLEDKEHYMLNI